MGSIKRGITTILKKHHYWRHAGFDELSELYIGMMFRSFAVSMIGIFIPLYLLDLGFTVVDILSVIAWYFTLRIGANYLAGHVVARYGPKHAILLSYVFQILTLAFFLTLPFYRWPLILVAIIWSISNSLFWVAYHVNFSKIKHTDHGGKELGTINIVSRIGYAIGPIIGGTVATFFGPQYAFLVATVFLFAGLIPLLSSHEQVTSGRRLDIRKVKLRRIWPDVVTYASLYIDDIANGYYWPLYMSLFILSGFAFAKLGGMMSVSMVVGMLTAWILGKLTDRHHGRPLYQMGRLGDAAIHFARPFIKATSVALGSNILYELFAVAVNLPLYKGLYDHCDDWDEHRAEYITVLEVISSVFLALVSWIAVFALGFMDIKIVLQLIFLSAGIMCCVAVLTERFKALD